MRPSRLAAPSGSLKRGLLQDFQLSRSEASISTTFSNPGSSCRNRRDRHRVAFTFCCAAELLAALLFLSTPATRRPQKVQQFPRRHSKHLVLKPSSFTLSTWVSDISNHVLLQTAEPKRTGAEHRNVPSFDRQDQKQPGCQLTELCGICFSQSKCLFNSAWVRLLLFCQNNAAELG